MMKEFKLNSREEVEIFSTFLNNYLASRTPQFRLEYINLIVVFDKLRNTSNGGRVFTALLDLKINLTLLMLDNHGSGATWSEKFSKGKLEGGTVFDSSEKFISKMDIHRYNTAFIFRYRAVWDKIMGLFILLYSPNNYDKFISAYHKKKYFIKIARQLPQIQPKFIKMVDDTLARFDNDFRTPEAHLTGRLWKFSFVMNSILENPSGQLIYYWNTLIRVLAQIDKIFKHDK